MKNVHTLKVFFKALLFTAGMLFAGWFFIPWKQVGEAVLLSAPDRLPKPASIAYSAVGKVPGGFTVSDLEIKSLMGMVDVSFNSFTVVPDVVASILGMAPTFQIAFTGAVIGDIAVTPLRKIPGVAPGSGRAVVSSNRQGIFLDDLRSDGELSASGSLLADLAAMKIIWADLVMDVKSESFEENLSVIASAAGLPLNQESPGRWILRRQRGSE